ncbi:MAG: hypothetical protein ACR2RL_20510 [Gammaproteobacteria bacterium]
MRALTAHASTRLLGFTLALALLPPASHAAGLVTEIFALDYTTVDEVAPVVRALVPPPGVVTGLGSQLIVKADEQTMAAVRRVLLQIDTVPKNLIIRVRQTMNEEVRRDVAGVEGVVVSGGGNRSRVAVHAGSRARQSSGSAEQRIRVLAGREAFIYTGQSVPVRDRSVIVRRHGVLVHESTRREDVGSGFYVRPGLRGNQITLEINPHRAHILGRSGLIERAETRTVLTIPLDTWIEISATSSSAGRSGSDIGAQRASGEQRESSVYLRVERSP